MNKHVIQIVKVSDKNFALLFFDIMFTILLIDLIQINACSLQDIPDGLVVRIRRSHRRGRGSIPRLGGQILFLKNYNDRPKLNLELSL